MRSMPEFVACGREPVVFVGTCAELCAAAGLLTAPALVCAGAASVRLIIVGGAFVFAVPALVAPFSLAGVCAGTGVLACAGVFEARTILTAGSIFSADFALFFPLFSDSGPSAGPTFGTGADSDTLNRSEPLSAFRFSTCGSARIIRSSICGSPALFAVSAPAGGTDRAVSGGFSVSAEETFSSAETIGSAGRRVSAGERLFGTGTSFSAAVSTAAFSPSRPAESGVSEGSEGGVLQDGSKNKTTKNASASFFTFCVIFINFTIFTVRSPKFVLPKYRLSFQAVQAVFLREE